MTALTLDHHVKRLQAAGLTVDEAVAQVSELVAQIESRFAAQGNLKEMEVALEVVVREKEVNLRRHIEQLAMATGRDFQALETFTRRGIDDLETRLECQIKKLEWIIGYREDR